MADLDEDDLVPVHQLDANIHPMKRVASRELLQESSKKSNTRQVSVRKLCPANFFLNCLLRQVFPQCSSYHNFNFSSII